MRSAPDSRCAPRRVRTPVRGEHRGHDRPLRLSVRGRLRSPGRASGASSIGRARRALRTSLPHASRGRIRALSSLVGARFGPARASTQAPPFDTLRGLEGLRGNLEVSRLFWALRRPSKPPRDLCGNPVRNACISSGRELETPWMNAHFSNVAFDSAPLLRSSVEDCAVLDGPSTLTPRVHTALVSSTTSRRISTLRRSLTCFSTARRVHEDDDEKEKKDRFRIPNVKNPSVKIQTVERTALDTNLGAGTP